MTPWWLVMMGGLLGSTHCIGMCGGFAAIVGMNTGTLAGNLRAQLIYSVGRILTYSAMGACAGFAGHRLTASAPALANVPAVLCLIAGLLLVREGLLAAGWWKSGVTGVSSTGCLLRPLFTAILKTPGLRNAFVAGIVTGFLPCGLVYAFVSLAASSGDLLQGMATMAAFGAGTVPLMVIAGCGASLLSVSARQKVWKAAAWAVVLTGLLTVGRGAAFLQPSSQPPQDKCPFCSNRTSAIYSEAPADSMASSQLQER